MMSPSLDGQVSILERAIAFFDSINWTYTRHESKPILSMRHQGKNGSWRCVAQARENDTHRQFIFYSVLESFTPPDKLPAMAEFLTRANYGLIIGNFELDFEDGEIRYKTSLDTEELALNHTVFKNVVYANLSMMDQYLPGIMSMLYANISPREVIDQIES